MKRGWITWDRTELPPAVFQERLGRVRKMLSDRGLPALVVYTDVWRSNLARYLTNFMPYWNRALLVVPLQDPPILLCSLSPRVYPWIRSVTVLEDIRAAANLARQLLQLCSDLQCKRIGVLDLPQIPNDIGEALGAPVSAGSIEAVDLPSRAVYVPASDEWEIAMRKRAAKMARQIVAENLAKGVGTLDYEFVGQLEREFRRAGAEELVILLSNGTTAPLPARGAILGEHYSVTLAVEYRGHWIRLSRPQTSSALTDSLRNRFESLLKDLKAPTIAPAYVEDLSGPYPYVSCDRSEVGRESIFALHVESNADGPRILYGDTCRYGNTGAEPL